MADSIQRLDLTRGGCWETAVAQHPEAGVFHDARWLRVLEKTYRRPAFYLEMKRLAGAPLLLPFIEVKSRLTGARGVSLPFTDFCPPLGAGAEGLGVALDEILAFGRSRGWSHFELRGSAAPKPGMTPSSTYCAHRLPLSRSARDVHASFASSAQRAWRKAEREGVTVSIGTSHEALQTFCQLHGLTRRRHGAPPQPRRFFEHLQNELLSGGAGFVAIARLGSQPIAAAVFLIRGATAVYKFGASDEAFQAARGNVAVMAHSLIHLAERGITEVHFGRTSVGNEGLRRFKRLWGAVEEPLHYYRLCVRTGRSLPAPDRASGLHTELFRRLPAVLNRWAGRLLYPHLD